MQRNLGARSLSALALVVAAGCFQPLDPLDPEADDDARTSPDASGPAATGGTAPKPQPAWSDAGAKPLAEAGIVPAQPGVGIVMPGGLPTQPGTGTIAPVGLPAQPGPSADPCTSLAPTACTSVPGCARVEAFAVHPMAGCSTGEIRPSCMKSEFGCTLLLGNLVARDTKGQTWRVPFSCVPPDLTPVAPQPSPTAGSCPSAATQAACALHRDLKACTEDPRWQCGPKTAARFDWAERCIGFPEGAGAFLGCKAAQYEPEPARLFRDPAGDVWEVSGSSLDAVPPAWTPIEASSVIPGAGPRLPRCFTVP